MTTIPTAIVVPTADNMQLAVVEARAKARLVAQEMLKRAEVDSKNLLAEPIRPGDGVTVPALVNAIKLNKRTGDKPADANDESWNLKVVIGSTKHVNGENLDAIKIPLKLAKVKNWIAKGAVICPPVSRITGSPIEHIMLVSGKYLTVFSDRVNAQPQSYAYLVKLEPSFAICPFGTDAKFAKGPDSISEIQSLIRAAACADPGKSVPHVQFVGAAAAAPGDAMASSAPVVPIPMGPVLSWYKPTPYARYSLPPVHAVRAYLDRHDVTMTDAQRMCFELEFPELAQNASILLPNTRLCVNWNCGSVIPVTDEKYLGQGRDDFIALVKLNPQIEKPLCDLVAIRRAQDASTDPNYHNDAADDTFIVVSRNETDNLNVTIQRIMDDTGAVPLATNVCYNTGIQRTSQCFSTISQSNRMCIVFNVIGDVWPVGEPHRTAEKTKMVLIGTAYEELITPAIGFTSNPTKSISKEKKLKDWDNIFKRLVSGKRAATIVYMCRIDHKVSGQLEQNFRHNTEPNAPVTWALHIDKVIADMATWLAHNAIPITAVGASNVLNTKVPDAKDSAVKPHQIGSVTCLTDEPNKFAACIALDCDFWAVTGKDIINDQITPELGDKIFSPEWDGRTKITGPIRNVVYNEDEEIVSSVVDKECIFDAQHPLRQTTKNAASEFVYIFASRKDACTMASAARAEKGFAIFNEGGIYDKNGYPSISNSTPAVAPVAMIANVPHCITVPSAPKKAKESGTD